MVYVNAGGLVVLFYIFAFDYVELLLVLLLLLLMMFMCFNESVFMKGLLFL